jgi:hypothetical protein
MKILAIAQLIAGALPVEAFSASMSDELSDHVLALRKGGASAPVQVTEDASLVLDRAGLAALCKLFAAGQLAAAELAYVADVLQLSERVVFADPSIADDLAECTDPEVNGPLSTERALAMAGLPAPASPGHQAP